MTESCRAKASTTCMSPHGTTCRQQARHKRSRPGSYLALEAVGDHVQVVGGFFPVLPRTGDAVQLVGNQVLARLNALLQLRQPLPVLRLEELGLG